MRYVRIWMMSPRGRASASASTSPTPMNRNSDARLAISHVLSQEQRHAVANDRQEDRKARLEAVLPLHREAEAVHVERLAALVARDAKGGDNCLHLVPRDSGQEPPLFVRLFLTPSTPPVRFLLSTKPLALFAASLILPPRQPKRHQHEREEPDQGGAAIRPRRGAVAAGTRGHALAPEAMTAQAIRRPTQRQAFVGVRHGCFVEILIPDQGLWRTGDVSRRVSASPGD